MNDRLFAPHELKLLADRVGVVVGPRSPLAELKGAQAGPDATSAEAGSPPNAEWRSAIETLALASVRIQVVTPGPDGSKIAGYYGTGDERRLAGCWAEGDRLRVSFPWTVDALLEGATQVLALESLPPPDPFTARLSLSGLLAMTACVDAMRHAAFDRLLTRRGGEETVLRVEDVERQLRLGSENADARWCTTLVRLLLPLQIGAGQGDVRQGLNELARVGLLERTSEDIRPAAALSRIAIHWASPLPAMAHQVLALQGERLSLHRHLIALRGNGPLWLFEFDDLLEAEYGLTMRSVDRSTYFAAIRERVSACCVSAPQPKETPDERGAVVIVDVAAQPPSNEPDDLGIRFIGEPVPLASEQATNPSQAAAKANLCSRCRNPLPDAAKFCTVCGAARDSSDGPAGAVLCSECRTPLKPGQRFCTTCGTAARAGKA